MISTLGFLVSIPGQTMGMAVFTDAFIEVLGLTRTELSMAYLTGTVLSSVFLTKAGRWFDRFGGRVMIAVSSLALGLMVFYISMVDLLTVYFGGASVVAFFLILIGYFGVRFFGQGVLASCSRNILMLWFVKRRGLVSGFRGVLVSFGFAIAPVLLAALILQFGWRGALWSMALFVGLGFSLLAIVFLRDSPEACGMMPDGIQQSDALEELPQVKSKTLREARKSPAFWVYSASLGMHAMFGTALTFHVVSIFSQAGRSTEEAFSYFLPAAIFSVISNLWASWLIDSRSLKPFLIIMLLAFISGAWGLVNLESDWGFWMLALGFGAGGGLWGVLSNLVHIRFFGPLHLGEISGMSASITVFASAVGPAAFSLGFDYFGTYEVAVLICLGMLICLLVWALTMQQQELPTQGKICD